MKKMEDFIEIAKTQFIALILVYSQIEITQVK